MPSSEPVDDLRVVLDLEADKFDNGMRKRIADLDRFAGAAEKDTRSTRSSFEKMHRGVEDMDRQWGSKQDFHQLLGRHSMLRMGLMGGMRALGGAGGPLGEMLTMGAYGGWTGVAMAGGMSMASSISGVIKELADIKKESRGVAEEATSLTRPAKLPTTQVGEEHRAAAKKYRDEALKIGKDLIGENTTTDIVENMFKLTAIKLWEDRGLPNHWATMTQPWLPTPTKHENDKVNEKLNNEDAARREEETVRREERKEMERMLENDKIRLKQAFLYNSVSKKLVQVEVDMQKYAEDNLAMSHETLEGIRSGRVGAAYGEWYGDELKKVRSATDNLKDYMDVLEKAGSHQKRVWNPEKKQWENAFYKPGESMSEMGRTYNPITMQYTYHNKIAKGGEPIMEGDVGSTEDRLRLLKQMRHDLHPEVGASGGGTGYMDQLMQAAINPEGKKPEDPEQYKRLDEMIKKLQDMLTNGIPLKRH